MLLETRPGERFAFGKTRETTVTFIACCNCEQSQAEKISVNGKCYNPKCYDVTVEGGFDVNYLSIVCNLCGRPYVILEDLIPTYTDDPTKASALRASHD